MKNYLKRIKREKVWLSCGFCGTGVKQIWDWKLNPEFYGEVWIFCNEDCLLAHAENNLGDLK